jgi:hypothetical protein
MNSGIARHDPDPVPIRVHSFVNENSLPYFEYMVGNYRHMASREADLRFIAYSFAPGVTPALEGMEGVSKVVELYRLPRFFVKQTARDWVKALLAVFGVYRRMGGSNGHAAGLNAAFANTGGGVDVIADTDTVVLKQDWDIFILDLLQQYGIVGTSYEEIGGASSGSGKTQTYKRLPSLTWIALSPRHDFTKLDAAPEKRANIVIASDDLSALYNLPVGFELARDVGWKLPQYLRDRGIPSAVFDQVKPSSAAAKAVKSGNDYHEEYHWQGEPFLAHQRGSHQHRFRVGDLSGSFYEACERYLSTEERMLNA